MDDDDARETLKFIESSNHEDAMVETMTYYTAKRDYYNDKAGLPYKFYIDSDKGTVYGPEPEWLGRNITNMNQEKEQIAHGYYRQETHLIITNPDLQKTLQQDLNKAYREFSSAYDAINPGFIERTRCGRHNIMNNDRNALDLQSYPVFYWGNNQLQWGSNKPAAGMDSTALHEAYASRLETALKHLEKYQQPYKPSNEPVFYTLVVAMRSIFRIFDILYTLCTTGKPVAGINNARSTAPFFSTAQERNWNYYKINPQSPKVEKVTTAINDLIKILDKTSKLGPKQP
ncbi:MAG: hypothetical protein NXI01_03510 [Gammaproteobacteria bacterium]|nr:hypothetical protein [Gammaproteobacteria bacterium]